MADQRKPYTLHVNGVPHTVLMDPEEAEKAGLKVAEKSVSPADTSAAADNKAGTARTK